GPPRGAYRLFDLLLRGNADMLEEFPHRHIELFFVHRSVSWYGRHGPGIVIVAIRLSSPRSTVKSRLSPGPSLAMTLTKSAGLRMGRPPARTITSSTASPAPAAGEPVRTSTTRAASRPVSPRP